MVLPSPPQDKAMMVVYREYAEPTKLAAKIDVDGTQIFAVPQQGFAHAVVDPGKHKLAIRWPAASGTPGWQGDAEWQPGQTYYYQLRGTSGHGWYFQSSLDAAEEGLAHATLKSCCRLITEMKSNATLATAQPLEPAARRTINLANITPEMLDSEVIAAIGSPDHVSSKSTGKKGIPFYFGSDTRRVSWSYSGVGYVVFSRNEYNGELRVFETKEDASAP
ncbi:hypothetical protein GCM10011487_26080 [Steroidobacter agaridevorans]|uniref:DUF2846 domain-containing protein n=1 Tax=Steroidobacter agaridevorans TaxID=2695856 RepID=A0A829YCN9_9GAMM|nr:hypothetical protein [Steroidobacter agaridevorans]GFE80608.1 hypothetical protein GCM10011487_26080 [Steroidobacter agaridevorans]